jgi:hypothetical protein
MNDPVWNAPPPVAIQGRQFIVRELAAGSLRLHLRDLVGILGSFAAQAEQATSDQQATMMLGLIDNYADEVISIMSESTTLQPAEIQQLPGSVFFELASLVLKAQEPMVKAFFHLRQQAAGLLAPSSSSGGSSNGSSVVPSSSAASSPPDSTTTPLPSA